MRNRTITRLLALPAALALALAGAAPASAGRDYVGLVNPWVEADIGRYFFFQSASQPFGFVKLRPDTSTSTAWGTGYRSNEDQVKGFSHLHDWQLSGVQVMPTSGASVPKTAGEDGWQSHVEHHDGSELVQPGYHRLHLDRYGITAELTATDRVGMHRYTYDKAGPSDVIVNLGGVLGEAVMKDAHVTKVSDRELAGWVAQRGGGYPQHDTKLYFDIRFDTPFDSLRGWSNGRLADGGAPLDELAGDNMGVYARYEHLDAGAVVQMKVGLSLTGVDGARKNLQTELPGWDFGAVKRASQARWNTMLGRVDVKGGTHQQRVKFYTDLFHVLCGRSTVSDVDGKYLDDTWNHDTVKQIPLDRDGRPKFAMYNYDALWLTQWNLNSVLGLAYPEIYSSFVHSQLQMYRDGGLLPRGPVAGNYSMVMTGSPTTSFIAGAWNKGIRDFDPQLAYDAMLDAQSVGGMYDKSAFEYEGWSGLGGARQYLEQGYVPQEVGGGPLNGGAGQTLEYSFQDWTLAQFARQLGERGVNVAQLADVSASSQANDSPSAAARAVDGRPIRSGAVEWASAGETNPWIQLDWDEPQKVAEVVLSDRAGASPNVGAGTLTFSDGSSVDVTGIPADGADKVVTFAPRTVDWVRFQATGGSGAGVGLNELEVWDDRDSSRYLLERSRNWRNLFDPSSGFIRPRNADGSWMQPFDPLSPEDFVEANSWQATWYTPHDVIGLANAMGGEELYANKLNFAFASAAKSNFIADYGDGYVSYGNQPGLELAHLFNYVGYPWLSQHWVREVKEKTYGATSTTDGYGHFDEDQGQMGALSALMAIGLFEVTGGSLDRPVYDITSPIFDEVTIDLNRDYYPGRRFKIITHGNSAHNQYIQRAKLDGKRLDNAWFRHDQLADGGTLQLWLGDQPNKSWGVDELPPSASASAGRHPVDATAIAISGPDRVEVPYQSVDFDAEFTPEDASLKEAFWSVTEPDGSPTDKAEITNAGVLTVNHRSGPVLVTATAADSGRVIASKAVRLDLDTSLLRGNAARWPGVDATASSEFSVDYPVSRVHDGFDRLAGDWASRGQQNPWVELSWPEPIRADRIVLYDRTSLDDANRGRLIFDDGRTVEVTGIPRNGDPKTITFPMKTFDHVRFQVEGGTGPNVGLLEFEVYAVPKAPSAPHRVSVTRSGDRATVSWSLPDFDGGAPVTGYVVRRYRDGELVDELAVGEDARQATMQAREGDDFTVAASNMLGTGPERGEPVFATAIDVVGPDVIDQPNASAAYRAEFTPADTTYKEARWTVTEPDGAPTEKAEIDADGLLTVNTRSGEVRVTATNTDGGPEVHGTKLVRIDIDPASIREDAARWPGVTATASSEFSSAFAADKVRDGFGPFTGDWASAGEQDPWVELRWDQPIQADRIVLYDRTSYDDANGGTLSFSDGSEVQVAGIPGNGDAKTVTFPMKTFDRVRFQVEGGTGPNVGLLELEVFALPAEATGP
jgi:predicted alpha-1,2-mannosidase